MLFAAAAGEVAEDPRALEGRPALALAQHADIAALLHIVSGGRRSTVSALLRVPGPPLAVVDGRYVVAQGCTAEGCDTTGLFMAYDAERRRLYLALIEDGAPSLLVPPRRVPWPEALAQGARVFGRVAADAITFGP